MLRDLEKLLLYTMGFRCEVLRPAWVELLPYSDTENPSA